MICIKVCISFVDELGELIKNNDNDINNHIM